MILFLIIFGVLVLLFVSGYNTLIRRRNRIENTFASIDVMLKKRFDLIPNLVQTVKRYAEHEAGVMEQIVKLRNRSFSELTTEEKMQMNKDLSQVQRSFQVMVEQYPDLKASQNFLQLQGALNETEEQISAARRTYNAAVTEYNNGVQTFPSNLVAMLMGFHVRTLLEIPSQERENIKVKDLFA